MFNRDMKSRSNNWGDLVPWRKRMGERTFSMGLGENMLPGRGAKLAAEVQWAQPSSRHSSPSPAITKSNTQYDSQQTLVPPGASQYDSQMTLVPYGDSQMYEYDEMSPQPMEDSPVLLSQPQNSHQDQSRDKPLLRPFAPNFNRPPMIPRPLPQQQQQQQQLNKHNQASQRGLRARSPVFENLKSLAAGGDRQAAPNWKETGQHNDISKVISTMRASTKSPGEDEIQRIVADMVDSRNQSLEESMKNSLEEFLVASQESKTADPQVLSAIQTIHDKLELLQTSVSILINSRGLSDSTKASLDAERTPPPYPPLAVPSGPGDKHRSRSPVSVVGSSGGKRVRGRSSESPTRVRGTGSHESPDSDSQEEAEPQTLDIFADNFSMRVEEKESKRIAKIESLRARARQGAKRL